MSGATLDLSKKFLYIPDSTASKIYGYAVGGSAGLTALAGSPFAAGITGPQALSAAGVGLYAINASSLSVQSFTVDATTGALTASGSPFTLVSVNCQVSSAVAFGYCVTNTGITTYSYDTTTGVFSSPGSLVPLGFTATNVGLVIVPSGLVGWVWDVPVAPPGPVSAVTATIQPFTISNTTGALTLSTTLTTNKNVVSVSGLSGSGAVTFDPQGRFIWMGQNAFVASYTVNGTTGAIGSSGTSSIGGGTGFINIAMAPPGAAIGAVLEADIPTGTATYHPALIDSSTGLLTATGTPTTFPFATDVYNFGGAYPVLLLTAYPPAGGTGTIVSYSVNTATGDLTQVSELPTGPSPQIILTTQ